MGSPSAISRFHPEPGGYLAFLGRISREKRVDRAIAIAMAGGWPLRIAAKVDRRRPRRYFKRDDSSLMDHPLIEFIGEITDPQKRRSSGTPGIALPDRLA